MSAIAFGFHSIRTSPLDFSVLTSAACVAPCSILILPGIELTNLGSSTRVLTRSAIAAHGAKVVVSLPAAETAVLPYTDARLTTELSSLCMFVRACSS